MLVKKARARRGRGAATVETAFVMVLLTSFVFGIFEYCRLLMDKTCLDNAVREGCRYALANNTSTTISTDVQTTVTNFLAGQSGGFTGLTVAVSGTHNGVATAVNSLVAGDLITVTVSGTYTFLNIVPIIKMPTSLTISSAVTMGCEGAT